ncbi:hypothetical protein CONLIGDRAFT_308670 [Coniochaeta ligniaria NRRL 30616]|uniref:Uncharacterized protein n=1 Tax=Coniochaeta ligniaria NRRL 30616 TaxID=1408157 RepID=A0A1J7IVD9_9PEZI|nr:hypothetical protein CONLIGDRAFT_308670 [Coniochaeta ligniaria NRRL 30616]
MIRSGSSEISAHATSRPDIMIAVTPSRGSSLPSLPAMVSASRGSPAESCIAQSALSALPAVSGLPKGADSWPGYWQPALWLDAVGSGVVISLTAHLSIRVLTSFEILDRVHV